MPRELSPGTMIGEYSVKRVLGQGGFGITYLAYDESLDRDVAIKEYFPKEFAHRDSGRTVIPNQDDQDRADFDWGMKHFGEEARSLTRFRHKNIVGAIRFIRDNATAYLVMEYCDGESLDSLAKNRGPLPEHVLLPIVNQLLDGLDEVHRTRLLHLDIKPSNIFLKGDGTVVLLDFGSARQAISSHTKSVKVASAGYAAIEQESVDIDIGKLGPWTDLYGLGATLYRLITGTRPPSASSRAFQESVVSLEETKIGQYGVGLLRAIDASLAFKPSDRPQTVADFRQMMRVEPLRTPVPEPSPDPVPAARKDRWLLGAVVVVFFVAAVWFTQNRSSPTDVEAGTLPDSAPVPIPGASDPGESDTSQCPSDASLVWNNCIGDGTYDPPYVSGAGEVKRYEGVFENDRPAKNGKITYVDGRVYEGEHQSLTLTGQGALWFPDGTKYVGAFKNNAQTGQGKKTWRTGTVAEGRFVNGVLMGKGSIREIDGTRYFGSFARNKLNGSGVKVTRSNGSEIRQVGDWKDGDLKVGILYVDCVATLRGIFEDGKMLSSMELSEADYPCK